MKTSSKVLLVIAGIFMIGAGVLTLICPPATLLWLTYLIGACALISGILTLIFYASTLGVLGSHWMLLNGLLDLVMAGLFLGNELIMVSALPLIFAMWVLFMGISGIIHAVDMNQMGGFRYWWMLLILGIACTGLGIWALLMPNVGMYAITILVSIGFILHGIAYFATVFVANKWQDHHHDSLK